LEGALVNVFGFAFLFSGLTCLYFLVQAVFAKGRRKSRLLRSGVAFLAVIGSLVGFSIGTDQEAQDQGFLDSIDRRHASEAGYTDPTAWAEVRGGVEASTQAEAKTDAVAKTKAAKALEDVVAYVTEVTHNLPSHFEDHGNMIPEEARMKPLTDEVHAYARFYWTVDSIENNCRFLGQRTNVQLLDPSNGVTSWVSTASMVTDHPNYAEYVAIFERFETAVSELGEAPVCSAMYRLLGPNGSLMEEALDINGLIDPEVLYRYEVLAEDGVLWSSKDYCQRRFYLEEPAQPSLHEAECREADAQDF
jgi:hypothetical protein